MTVYDLKPAFQNLLRPLCSALASRGMTANQVTVSATVISLAAGAAFAAFPGQPGVALLLPVVLLLRMALNAIDGMLAREHGQQSRLGGMLNELGDVVSDAALYLPFARVPGVAPEAVVAAVLLALLTELTGVLAIQAGGTRRYDGPMGKSDRALCFGLVALLLGLGVEAGTWTRIVLIAMCALMLQTILNRASRSLRQGSDRSAPA
jgi:CDP-diacylglycerol---glycerol-3-phosphate 3-phosphatidyltransferase